MVFEKYYGTWCAPCKMLAPVIEKVKEEFPDVEFKDIDIDEQPEKTNYNNVRSVPTIIIKKDGEEVDRHTGTGSKSTIEKLITENLD